MIRGFGTERVSLVHTQIDARSPARINEYLCDGVWHDAALQRSAHGVRSFWVASLVTMAPAGELPC